MASREKRALAPSRTKQKANNDSSSSLPATSESNNSVSSISNSSTSSLNSSSNSQSRSVKKSSVSQRSNLVTNPRASQLAREIVEAVATGSQLPAKLEASLPRKRVLQTALKRKQKARKTLIKAKQKAAAAAAASVVVAPVRRITGGIKGRRRKNPIAEPVKYKGKTTKKPKTLVRDLEWLDQNKVSPKFQRRKRAVKGRRKSNFDIVKKEVEVVKIKEEVKDEEDEEFFDQEELEDVKAESINDSSIEVTIEEVIASSMLVEPNTVQVKVEESEGEIKNKRNLKSTTVKRSLRNGKLRQIVVKVEPDTDQKKGVGMSEASVENVGMESKQSLCLDGEVTTVTVKVEATSEDESTGTTNHVNCTENSDVETNNNGCDGATATAAVVVVEEIGPTLRSKTKARNSDSSSEASAEDAKPVTVGNKVDAVDAMGRKERVVAKLSETKSGTASPAAISELPKSRRSSMNVDLRRNSFCNEKSIVDSPKSIDDMIDEIKQNIAKTIERKLFNVENKATGLLGVKNFDVKVEEVVAPLSNDSAKSRLDEDAGEESSNVSKSKDLGTSVTNKEISTEDVDNSVPKVADTAKEIEKLVMGDIEPTDSKPAEDKVEKPTDDAAAAAATATVSAEPANAKKEEEQQDDNPSQENTSNENCNDTAEKDSNVKSESTKKSPVSNCIKRKSPRSTAGKSSNTSSDAKKLLNSQSVCKELDKLADETTEEVEKTTEKVTSKTLSNESNEGQNENKTVAETKKLSEEAKDTEVSTPKSNLPSEKMDVHDSVEVDKCEETLESLSRDVERLVEEDDNKVKDIEENDASSDVEMRLVIDDDASESITEKVKESNSGPQINAKKDDCDQNNSTESSSHVLEKVKVAATTESTSNVQENPETEKTSVTSATDTDSTATITTSAATVKSGTENKAKDVLKTPKLADVEKIEEQKETRRVLRTRGDKQKKIETMKSVPTTAALDKSDTKTVKSEEAATSEVPSVNTQNSAATNDNGSQNQEVSIEALPSDIVIKVEPEEQLEPQIRTRRSREVKRQVVTPVSTPKSKRGPKKQEAKKVDSQQTKEETLLDNEVAKINENNRSTSNDNLRVVSANAGNSEQLKHETKSRSKSENDLGSTLITEAENTESTDAMKSMYEAGSTDGESSSSVEQIHETPEDRAKKEDVLRQLGLESWERVKEREAKKEGESKSDTRREDDGRKEQQSTGTLKTVIRIQKEKDGKKRSRSPLKMILKQQGRVDGEDSIDFYTIQKEIGTGGSGESSSGANRKLPTNPRHSCDNNEDNEDAPLKDRQSLVIPEKSSSFSIHPERLCADNCCYCHGKFGSLDTPMHLAQMKSDTRRNKILVIESHLTPDSCLCDACYRHVDRKANSSPTTLQLKPQRQNRQFLMRCVVSNCADLARHHVKRRWLIKIKSQIRNQVDMNWESTQHNLVPFCETHYTKISRFLTCALCKRRLTRNYTNPLGLSPSETEELNARLQQQGIPASIVAHTFVCRLCKFFTKLNFKSTNLDNMSDNNRDFYKKYRKKLLYCYQIECDSEEEEIDFNQSSKIKDKHRSLGIDSNKKSKSGPKQSSKSPDNFEIQSTSASDKSTPEPPRHDIIEPEVTIKEENITFANSDSRPLGIEGAIEKLKKRKALDTSLLSSVSNSASNGSGGKGVVEILSIDKEVTLTRLPKKPRLMNNSTGNSNDITPVVQRLGANPSISVRTLFPGEEEMNLHANVEFNNIREVTPQGWEKCATIIQYDRDTKLLWQELQRPYGNQSSFLRHLILLEKYYRAGDLILAPNASRNAINYSTSVQNRLISYEGPEKTDEPVMDTVNTIEYNNSRRLSGGYILENRGEHRSMSSNPSTSSGSGMSSNFVTAQLSKLETSSRPVKLTPGVSIIKKPPPNLQRLNTSGGGVNGSAKRKESIPIQKVSNVTPGTGGKVIQLTEPDYKRFQNLKRQKQMMNERQATSSPNSGSGSSGSTPTNYKANSTIAAHLQNARQQLAAQQAQQAQFQKHLRMQQEMLNQRSRSEFEPVICDIRLANENTPTQNLINTLNLPKSIQVTTKAAPVAAASSNTPIPILPKIPKGLSVIPQTVPRLQDK